jgi:hypothetical protein
MGTYFENSSGQTIYCLRWYLAIAGRLLQVRFN